MIDQALPPEAAPTRSTVGSPSLDGLGAPGSTRADMRLARERSLAHVQRCRRLPPVSASEAERLVAQFLAKRGGVTQCPPAYLAPVR